VDVNLEAGVISIRQTRVAVDFIVFLSEPKTATSRRPIALDPLTIEALRSHRSRQHAERLHTGEVWQDTGLVFVREDGIAYHPERITMVFKREVRVAGLSPIRLHDLRHTSATLALVAGIHPKVVQERLGHASINITLDTYSHVVQGLQRDAAEQIAGLLT
jgi:integrase